MAGGQGLTSGQGSVTPSESKPLSGSAVTSGSGTLSADLGPTLEALTGSEATPAAGTAVASRILPLRSRKVGGGAATRALTGSSVALAAGAVVRGLSQPITGQSASLSVGAFQKTRDRALTGTAVSVGAGTPFVQGGALTSFTLTSTATNSAAPFTIGHVFTRGATTSIQTSLTNYQVTIKRLWSDGSIKHAIISGRAPLTANVPLTVTVSTGTPPSGTALTSASIQAAAPTASVQCGSIGTVSLASLLASPVRTWISGPQMVECHYRATVSGNLSAWFHVRLFAGGAMWVRAFVENGYLDNGSGALATNSDLSYVPTVIIGGTTVYSNGGAALSHYANTRWTVEGWIGTDPAVTPAHSATYLRSSKMVPGYAWTTPTEATLNGLTQTYTPMSAGDIPAGMSVGGDSTHVGLLPVWDALFCTTGDPRAYRSVLTNSSAINSRAIVWRSRTDNTIPTPSGFPTWTIAGGPGGLGTKELTRGGLQWEYHHDVNEGYLAYLLTGDYWHYESMAMQAAMKFLCISSSKGPGTNRIVLHDEIRGIAWALRTIGCYVGIAPTGDTVADNYRTWLDLGGYQHWRSKGPNNPSGNQLGYPVALSTYNEALPLTQSPWMMHYWIATNGFVWDVEPGFSDTSAHLAVRDWMYQGVVGLLGPTGSVSYYYTLASNDTITISPNVKANFTYTEPAEFYSTWGQVYTATFGSANANTGTTLQGTSGGDPVNASAGRWGYLIPAISYAVEHQAQGAFAAYSRLTNATNWSTVTGSGFDNYPKWGCLPRAVAMPTWLSGQAVNTWREISGTDIMLATPTNTARTTSGVSQLVGPSSRLEAWCGLSIDARTSKVYSVANGGHGDYFGNEVLTINLLANAPLWSEVLAGSSGDVVNAASDLYTDGKPASTHSYYGQHILERHNRALRWGGSVSNGGGKVEGIASYNITSNSWDAWPGSVPPYGYSLLGSSVTVFHELGWSMTKHPDTEDFYVLGQSAFRRFRPAAVAPGLTLTSMAALPSQVGSGIEGATAIDTTRNRLMWLKGNGGLYSDPITFNLETGASTLQTFQTSAAATALRNMPVTSGTPIGAAMAMVYVPPPIDAYFVRANAAGGRLWKINASTWAVEYVAETGGSSIPAGTGGDDSSGQQKIYTRLLYVPSMGGLVYFPRGSANAWFYRLPVTSLVQPSYFVDFTALTSNESPISRGGVWTNASTGTGGNAALSPNNSMQIRLSANGTTRICCETGSTNNYDDSISVVPGFPGNQRVTATIYRQAGYTPTSTNHELLMELGLISYAVNNKRCVHIGFNYAGGYFVAGFNGDLVSWDAPPIGTLSSPWYSAATGAGTAPADGDVMIAELDRSAKTVKVWQKRGGVSTLVISLQWSTTAQVNSASQTVLNALGNSAGLGALRRVGADAVEGAFGWRDVLIESF